jgi:hypothetical protein
MEFSLLVLPHGKSHLPSFLNFEVDLVHLVLILDYHYLVFQIPHLKKVNLYLFFDLQGLKDQEQEQDLL